MASTKMIELNLDGPYEVMAPCSTAGKVGRHMRQHELQKLKVTLRINDIAKCGTCPCKASLRAQNVYKVPDKKSAY